MCYIIPYFTLYFNSLFSNGQRQVKVVKFFILGIMQIANFFLNLLFAYGISHIFPKYSFAGFLFLFGCTLLSGCVRDFHRLEYAHVGRTKIRPFGGTVLFKIKREGVMFKLCNNYLLHLLLYHLKNYVGE